MSQTPPPPLNVRLSLNVMSVCGGGGGGGFASCWCDSDTEQIDTTRLFLTLVFAALRVKCVPGGGGGGVSRISVVGGGSAAGLDPPGLLPDYPRCLLTRHKDFSESHEDVFHFLSVLLQVHELSVSLPFSPVPVTPSLSCLPSSP